MSKTHELGIIEKSQKIMTILVKIMRIQTQSIISIVKRF